MSDGGLTLSKEEDLFLLSRVPLKSLSLLSERSRDRFAELVNLELEMSLSLLSERSRERFAELFHLELDVSLSLLVERWRRRSDELFHFE